MVPGRLSPCSRRLAACEGRFGRGWNRNTVGEERPDCVLAKFWADGRKEEKVEVGGAVIKHMGEDASDVGLATWGNRDSNLWSSPSTPFTKSCLRNWCEWVPC